MRIRTDTNGRDETLRMLMQATGEKTKTGALFCAAEHYLEDKRNKERVIRSLRGVEHVTNDGPVPVIETLSTHHLPMEIDVTTRVGKQE